MGFSALNLCRVFAGGNLLRTLASRSIIAFIDRVIFIDFASVHVRVRGQIILGLQAFLVGRASAYISDVVVHAPGDWDVHRPATRRVVVTFLGFFFVRRFFRGYRPPLCNGGAVDSRQAEDDEYTHDQQIYGGSGWEGTDASVLVCSCGLIPGTGALRNWGEI